VKPRQASRRRSTDPRGVLHTMTVALMSVQVRAIVLPQDDLAADLRRLPHDLIADEDAQAFGYESAVPVAEPLGLLVLDPASRARSDIGRWLRSMCPVDYTLAVLYAADLDEATLDRLVQSASRAVARTTARDASRDE